MIAQSLAADCTANFTARRLLCWYSCFCANKERFMLGGSENDGNELAFLTKKKKKNCKKLCKIWLNRRKFYSDFSLSSDLMFHVISYIHYKGHMLLQPLGFTPRFLNYLDTLPVTGYNVDSVKLVLARWMKHWNWCRFGQQQENYIKKYFLHFFFNLICKESWCSFW